MLMYAQALCARDVEASGSGALRSDGFGPNITRRLYRGTRNNRVECPEGEERRVSVGRLASLVLIHTGRVRANQHVATRHPFSVLSRTLNCSVLGETLTCALCVAGDWSGRMAGAWGFQGGRGNSLDFSPCAAGLGVMVAAYLAVLNQAVLLGHSLPGKR